MHKECDIYRQIQVLGISKYKYLFVEKILYSNERSGKIMLYNGTGPNDTRTVKNFSTSIT